MSPPADQKKTDRKKPSGSDYDYGDLFEPEPPKSNPVDRLKNLYSVRRVIALGLVVVLIIGFVSVTRQFDPPGSPTLEEVILEVPAGTTTTGIVELLETNDVIPSALAMRAWLRIKGENSAFQAGEYTFHKNSSAGQALEVLKSGPDTETDRLVIPEGLRLTQVADVVGRLPGRSAARFMELARSGEIRSEFQPDGFESLEGFVFPTTYFIGPNDDERVLLQRMVNEFDGVARDAGLDQAPRIIQRSTFDTLIIASMIESEARVDADRGKISTVIQNRLADDMNLQIDATVLYALGNDRQRLSIADTRVASPYNTYTNAGLPPGPISNPGRESINAALRPEPGPWKFYVVTEADGTHTFATTGEEHERNVALARQRGYVQ